MPIEPIRREYQHYISTVAHTLETIGVPDPDGMLAVVVFAALDGLALQHLIFGDSDRTEQALVALRRILTLASGPSGYG